MKMRGFIGRGPNYKEQQAPGNKARPCGYYPSRKRKLAAGKSVGAKNCRK